MEHSSSPACNWLAYMEIIGWSRSRIPLNILQDGTVAGVFNSVLQAKDVRGINPIQTIRMRERSNKITGRTRLLNFRNLQMIHIHMERIARQCSAPAIQFKYNANQR